MGPGTTSTRQIHLTCISVLPRIGDSGHARLRQETIRFPRPAGMMQQLRAGHSRRSARAGCVRKRLSSFPVAGYLRTALLSADSECGPPAAGRPCAASRVPTIDRTPPISPTQPRSKLEGNASIPAGNLSFGLPGLPGEPGALLKAWSCSETWAMLKARYALPASRAEISVGQRLTICRPSPAGVGAARAVQLLGFSPANRALSSSLAVTLQVVGTDRDGNRGHVAWPELIPAIFRRQHPEEFGPSASRRAALHGSFSSGWGSLRSDAA